MSRDELAYLVGGGAAIMSYGVLASYGSSLSLPAFAAGVFAGLILSWAIVVSLSKMKQAALAMQRFVEEQAMRIIEEETRRDSENS